MYPQVFGKYVLERELSRGGMARVVLATLRGDPVVDDLVVVPRPLSAGGPPVHVAANSEASVHLAAVTCRPDGTPDAS